MYNIEQEHAIINIVEIAKDYCIPVDDYLCREYEKIIERRKNTMKVKYEMTLKVTVSHDIEGLKNLKDNREYAEDLAQMICDEATVTGGVAVVDVIESTIDVK